VKVGNPDRDTTTKATLDVSIVGSGDFDFQEVGLNLSGMEISASADSASTQSFALSRTVTFSTSSVQQKQAILDERLQEYGNYETIRLLFNDQMAGYVSSSDQVLPIQAQANRSYLDINVPFELAPGRHTSLVIVFAPAKSLQLRTDKQGNVISYEMNGELAVEVEDEDIAAENDSESGLSTPQAYSSYRLIIHKVNEERRASLEQLTFRIAGQWLSNDFNDDKGTIGTYRATVSASSTDDGDPWAPLIGRKWESERRFIEDSGQHEAGEAEYIQFDFSQEVTIDGYKLMVGDSSGCPHEFYLAGLTSGTWQLIRGSSSKNEACNLTEIVW
jgi:hypothetical protein